MKRTVALLLLFVSGCAAETPAPVEPGEIVTLDEIPDVRAIAGETVRVEVSLEVARGYHVQANPAADEFLIPLELSFEAVEGIEPGPPEYPPPHLHRLQGTDQDLLTYEGETLIHVPLAVAAQAPAGPRAVTGSLRYQACNDVRCFAPVSIPVACTVVVVR